MMNDAVAEGGGENFANNGFARDEGDAAGGDVGAVENSVAEVDEVFEFVQLEMMFIFLLPPFLASR